jgi:uncharacterized FlaG/YvyC family protein
LAAAGFQAALQAFHFAGSNTPTPPADELFDGSLSTAAGGDMNLSSISSLSSHLTTAAQLAPPKSTEDQKALVQAVKTVNAAQMFGQENELTFRIDRAAGIAVVRIVNRETGELVQEIPNEQVLALADESNEGDGRS